MAIAISHHTAADGTFSALGATEWNLAHDITGLTQYGVIYADTTTSIAQAAGFTFGGSAAGTGLAIAAGTATTAVSPFTLSQTRNSNSVTHLGVTWTFTDTSVGATAPLFTILGGASGSTTMLSLAKDGSLTAQASGTIANFGGVVATSTIQAATTFKFGATGTILQSGADGVVRLANNAQGQNAYLNTPADNVLAVNTSAAQGAAGSFRGKYQSSDATAGVASFGPAAVASITVKDGIIVAIS